MYTLQTEWNKTDYKIRKKGEWNCLSSCPCHSTSILFGKRGKKELEYFYAVRGEKKKGIPVPSSAEKKSSDFRRIIDRQGAKWGGREDFFIPRSTSPSLGEAQHRRGKREGDFFL